MPEFDGLPACDCLAEWLPVFEVLVGRELRWFQLIGNAPASAGFHEGGGSADSEPLSDDELRIARNMGGAAWNRLWAGNFHCHIRLNGCPHNSVAQPQVADLNAGRDGTGPLWDNTGVPDNGPRDGVQWPLRTWQAGIEWAKEQGDWIDMATEQELTRLLQKEVVAPLRDSIRKYAAGIRELVRGQHKQVVAALEEARDGIDDAATKTRLNHAIQLIKDLDATVDATTEENA